MSWSMAQDDGLQYAQCPNCSRRYPCSITECRECGASLVVVEPRRDGTRRIYLAGQLSFTARQEMSRRAAARRKADGKRCEPQVQ
jgi:hypothetical protein